MENTLENKVRFFAQYLKQPVYVNKNWDKFKNPVAHLDPTYLITGSNGLSEGYLYLKPLSPINDEDALELSYNNGDLPPTSLKGKRIIDIVENGDYWLLSINDIDYLRSKGYALPWMGLSVEKLIEYGWVKLQEATECK